MKPEKLRVRMSRFEFLNKARTASQASPGRKRTVRVVLGAAALAIGTTVVLGMFTTYIQPFETGIKQSRYGGGIDKAPYPGPGLYLTAPGVTFHRFPTVAQTVTMNSSAAESMAAGDDMRAVPSLEIDRKDGSKIKIDATILYRIKDPYVVMTTVGPGRMFEDNAVIPKAVQAIKNSLGQLQAEDFYDERLRVEAAEAARAQLEAALAEFGLTVDHILIRQYYYLSDYQSQIEERKVQDQLVFTNQSMAEAAKMEAIRSRIDAEGGAQVEVEQQRGQAEVAKIRAEADLYSRKKRSEGDLLVALAQAQGTELENAAYRAGSGADNLVGLEMAEVLEGIEVIFVQGGQGGTNVLDVNDTLRMFDVK